MFWNDPNLYSVAFKDIPNYQLPFLGTIPRMYNPYEVKPYFAPPVTPTYFTPPITPQMFTPQMFTPPVSPYMHSPAFPQFVNPMINPLLTPYSYTLPYFQGYRPFGL